VARFFITLKIILNQNVILLYLSLALREVKSEMFQSKAKGNVKREKLASCSYSWSKYSTRANSVPLRLYSTKERIIDLAWFSQGCDRGQGNAMQCNLM
jgi:hypothetical protein